MAKEPKTKGKIRVFLFELEGSDETLLESVRNIAGAVSRTFAGGYIRSSVKALPPASDNGEQEALVEESVEEASDNEGDLPSTITKAKRSRRYTAPKVLSIDLVAGDIPFKTFCEQKKPGSHAAKYLVIATWLKQYAKLDEISINHVYTCYRAMDWPSPKDMGRTFIDGKQAGNFDTGTKRGLWKINHIGLDRVLQTKSGG